MASPILTIERYRSAGARYARLWELYARPVAGAMTTTGSGALASGLLAALAAKILATAGGPAALATLVTLQQVRQGAMVASTVNGQTALIQGASARAGQARREYVRTAAVLFLAGTGVVAAALLAFPGSLWRMTGLAPVPDSAVRWLALSIVFSSVSLFFGALLNALRKIGTLAALQVVAPLVLVVGMRAAAHGESATFAPGGTFPAVPLALLLALSAASGAAAAGLSLASAWARWREWVLGSGARWSDPSARAFLSVAMAMLVSGLLASATVLAVRGRVIEQQGLAVAGWFDAAWNVSMNHASLLLASLQTYCLPALSRAKSPREQSAVLAGVWMLALPAAAAMIVALALTKPWVLTLLYAPSFRPAAALLRWTLVGDYCKIASWIMSLPLLARADMKAVLLLDTVAYATFAGASVLLPHWLPAGESAAAGFASMYAVHLVVGTALARGRCGIRFEPAAVVVWSAGLALVGAVSAFTWNRL